MFKCKRYSLTIVISSAADNAIDGDIFIFN